MRAGPKGTGKTFQTELSFKKMKVEPVVMSAGELESVVAGRPGYLVRRRYRLAADMSKSRGIMSAMLVNDLDAGIGRHDVRIPRPSSLPPSPPPVPPTCGGRCAEVPRATIVSMCAHVSMCAWGKRQVHGNKTDDSTARDLNRRCLLDCVPSSPVLLSVSALGHTVARRLDPGSAGRLPVARFSSCRHTTISSRMQ